MAETTFSKVLDCDIEIRKCVIIYPVRRELFALAIRAVLVVNEIKSTCEYRGPLEGEKVVAKISSMTIMRLPRWKGMIARRKS